VFRPLIDLTKNEITQLCKKYKIPYIHDETNDNPKTSLRNFLRIKLLPQIYKLSNKKDKLSNSFIESMSTIYKQLDQEEPDNNLLKDTIKSPYRNHRF
jgi:tRNA(Ile)-lysidine synthase TilS/MesJ